MFAGSNPAVDSASAVDVLRAVAGLLGTTMSSQPEEVQMEELLEAARAAIPRKREPHPCATTCWRVGVASDIDENGKCVECGFDGVMADRRRFQELMTPEAAVSLLEGWLEMRRATEHPALVAAAYVGGLAVRK